jgi:ABC-type transporter Mla MlaB component
MSSADISLQNNRLMVSGDLNFATVMNLLNQSLPLLSQCPRFDFDFSNVISANSAVFAIMLEWMKQAKRVQKTITFSYLPAQFSSIIKVLGLSEFV